MSVLVVIFLITLLTGIMGLHVRNESNLSKRIVRARDVVQQLLDQNGIQHIDLEKKFSSSSLSTQIRLIEYHLNYLDGNYKDFGSKKSVFQRISKIETVLSDYYGYGHELSLS